MAAQANFARPLGSLGFFSSGSGEQYTTCDACGVRPTAPRLSHSSAREQNSLNSLCFTGISACQTLQG